MTDNSTNNSTSKSKLNSDTKKTKIRMVLESLEAEIYISWIRDLDKTTEFSELNNILLNILNCESLEIFFDNNESDLDYFLNKFSKESIINILRQHFIIGENGDEIGLDILVNYLRIFIKFINKANYLPLWESIKEIFDPNKPYYKGIGYNSMISKIDEKKKIKKQMSVEYYNEYYLPQKPERFSCIKLGEEIEIFTENKKSYSISEKRLWTRAKITEVRESYFMCLTSEEENPIRVNKKSFDYAPIGVNIKDYEWRLNLKEGDLVDCLDRGKYYPGTIISKQVLSVNGLPKIDYRIGFRLYPEDFPEWEQFKHFWPENSFNFDKENRRFFGNLEAFDEIIPFNSKKLQKFNTMINPNFNFPSEENFCLDDYIIFDFEEYEKNNPNEIKFEDRSKFTNKTYVLAKSTTFSYFYGLLISKFAADRSYEKMLNILHKSNPEKPNPDLIYYIFLFIGLSSTILHKEFIKLLAFDMKENVISYLNDLNQIDLRNMKKETIDIITKVLRYYLNFSVGVEERNEIIENFGISFSLKMLKSSLLDKRISAVKNIIEIIKSSVENQDKSEKLMKIIEENKIFYEIFGPNSHIQLISRSKDLLQIMLTADKLSKEEMEIIWSATKKGDLEGKLTILKLLKEISIFLRENHIKMLLDNIYLCEAENLIKEEIDLIYDLATHYTQSEKEIKKIIDYFLKGLYNIKVEDNDDDKLQVLVNKIVEITKEQKNRGQYESDKSKNNENNFLKYVIDILLTNIKSNNLQNSYISLKLLKIYLNEMPEIYMKMELDDEIEQDNQILLKLEELPELITKNFDVFKKHVRNLIKQKNWNKDIDLLQIDNFSYSQNLKMRLEFINLFIRNKIWMKNSDPIIYVFNMLIEDNISDKDSLEFYSWIKNLLNNSKLDYEIEENIFNLFNEKICAENKKCQSLSMQAFESYLKIFLDINKRNSLLDFNYSQNEQEITLYTIPEKLIGFEILWRIVFQSFSSDIMNKGIQTLHLLYSNKNSSSGYDQSEILLKKCIDLIKETIKSEMDNQEKHNIIIKCLYVLRLMIEESEKKGTSGIKSHSGLIKNKTLLIKVNCYIPKVDDFKLKLFGNTTYWDLREIISKKISISVDYLKMRIKDEIISDTSNGKTILDFNLKDGDEIDVFMNDFNQSIPQAELITKSGTINPKFMDILNSWFDQYSEEKTRMTKQLLGKFIQNVTNTSEELGINDYRINSLFESFDFRKEGFIPREGFILFYTECLQKADKRITIWENLHNMGIKNDLTHLNEGIENKNINKNSLPRYKLAHNEEFFNTLFYLQDSNEIIAKDAFEFLCVICTNPKIYRTILNGNNNWEIMLDKKNIYKLIYSLQIIESFLEEIEIETDGVDFILQEDYIVDEEKEANINEKNIEDMEMKEINEIDQGTKFDDDIDLDQRDPELNKNDKECEIKKKISLELNVKILKSKERKIEWMKNFIENNGFSHLVDIIREKLHNYKNESTEKENHLMNRICLQLLLKIVKVFYNRSLSKYSDMEEIKKLLDFLKLTYKNEINIQMEETVPKDVNSLNRKTSSNEEYWENGENKEAAYKNLDNELSEKESQMKIDLIKKNYESKYNSLDKIFEGPLGDKIINSIQNSNISAEIFDLLRSFDLKNNFSNFNTIYSAEEKDIIENSIDLLCALLSINSNLKDNFHSDNFIEILTNDAKKQKEFSDLCLYALINPNQNIREKSEFSLIRLCKILDYFDKYEVVLIIFNQTFEFLINLQKDAKNSSIGFSQNKNNKTQNSNFSTSNTNHSLNSNFSGSHNHMNLMQLFEFFSNILKIYFEKRKTYEKLLFSRSRTEENNLSIEEYLLKIAAAIQDDISNIPDADLPNEIFIGYIKILGKVVENVDEIKLIISEKFNLIQDIMTKVLFKENSNVTQEINQVKLINPDNFSDSKASRRKNQTLRNACFRFILAMLKNSVTNFEKFFAINILDDNSTNKPDNNLEREDSYTGNFQINLPGKNFIKKLSSNYSIGNNWINNATKSFGHVGLKNLGCICYMNSMLQQFFMVPSFRHALLQANDDIAPDFNNAYNIDDNAFHQIQRMFAYLSLSNREDYNPIGFCMSFKDYEGNPTNTAIQQDAQEFLARFIDKIEFTLKPTSQKYLIHSVFGGKSCSQLICEEGCNTARNRYEDMFFLSLSVQNMKNIYDSMDKFISEEKIDEYQCDTCNKKVTITKRNVLAELPNVLIVHLQRIYYNYETDRNEKINSRLEFPKVLNLKDYTLEELARRNYVKQHNLSSDYGKSRINEEESEENSSKEKNGEINENQNIEKDQVENQSKDKYPFENDEIYFKNDQYYEYHLVGVNVHIGSADAGHYFSYINKLRGGVENIMAYNPKDENQKDLWLKFNDSYISRFNVEKLEEECYGGKFENSEDDNQAYWNFGGNNESIQSAYMLIYERRIKNPIKIVIPPPEDNQTDTIISYKEEEEKAVNKECNLLYHYGKENYEEKSNKIFNSIFYDNAKNEYYKYCPFFNVENLIPVSYYQEITDDNNRLEKQQNISDEQFIDFFENVIRLLDETIKNSSNSDNKEFINSIVKIFMEFIFNILSSGDKIKLLKTAKKKLISITDKSYSRLLGVIDYLNENHEKIFKFILNDNSEIVEVHCDLIYEIISNIYKLNYEIDCLDDENPDEFKEKKAELMNNSKRLVDFVLFLFPKIPGKKTDKLEHVFKLLKNLCGLSLEMMKYFASREVIFIFITFLLGRDSPFYKDTLSYPDEEWDYGRNTIYNVGPLIEMIYSIYSKYQELNFDYEGKDNENNEMLLLSERDLTCIKNSHFLKIVYKADSKIFSDLIIYLSKDDIDFTYDSCILINQFIDDVSIYDEKEFLKIVNALLPVLDIEDEHQLLRFCIVLGYPQLITEDGTYYFNHSLFGFHAMTDSYSKIIEIKSLVSLKNTCCLMKKVFSCISRDRIFIEIFLAILQSSITNPALLKYIKIFNSEDCIGDDYVNIGVSKVKEFTNHFNNKTFFNQLFEIVTDINVILPNILTNNKILKGFSSFTGKYIHKNIKREIYSLLHSEKNFHILKIEYFTDVIEFKDMESCDFSKSKTFTKNTEQTSIQVDEKELESESETELFKEMYPEEKYFIFDFESKNFDENEFINGIILPMDKERNKPTVVYTNEKIEGYTSNLIRYLAVNNSAQDAKLSFKIKKINLNQENYNQNEFIPEGEIILDIPKNSSRNVVILVKVDLQKNWSFEPNQNQPQANLDYTIAVELKEPQVLLYPGLNRENFAVLQEYNRNMEQYNNQLKSSSSEGI